MHGEPVRYESQGTILTAHRCGVGQPVVLMHGSGLDDHRSFDAVAAALASAYLVLGVDVRGYGLSPCADASLHTWDQYAADVVALLDQLALSAAVVGGFSLGSGVALATVTRHAERVRGLLLSSPAWAGEVNGLTERQELAWADGRRKVASIRSIGLRQTILAANDQQPLDPLTAARLARQDEPSLLAALEGELQTRQPFASEDQLRQVSVPALIVPGLDDAHDPLVAEIYQRCLPRAVTVDGFPPLGDPARVRAFLDRCA